MNQSEWQDALDTAFPVAVNVRIVPASGNEDDEIDFAAACLNVMSAQGDDKVTLRFGDVSTGGKVWLVTGTLKQVQETPRVRYELIPDKGQNRYWFWPRPLGRGDDREEFERTKRNTRESATTMMASA